ncbi:hypothetical protein HGA92_01370 [Candidatus Gracilibacteria bacterium]|nr:hypothetical protein [Candidatus Gracilibacteria bacterium]NUJ98741.1 hypothetical protein [Candidatus Gracilibacteria bacterium]
MKKIILFLVFFLSFFVFSSTFATCTFGTDISSSLENCFSSSNTKIVTTDETLGVEDGLKVIIANWVKNISIILSFVAVLYIVVGAFKLVTSAGNDDKVKKGKETIKWASLGFLALISLSSLIALVINYMFK